MAKTLTAKFKAVDEMSAALDKMANNGAKVCAKLDTMKSASTAAAQKISEVECSCSDAAAATYEWTDKLGSYNKGALEAIYTNDELVDMGLKTKTTFEEAITSTDELSEGLDKLGESSTKASEEIDKVGKQSQQTKEDVDGLGEKSQKTGKEMEDAFEAVSGLLATIGISAAIQKITDSLAECSEVSMTFETSMAAVATIADTSMVSLEDISAGVRDNAIEVATYSSDYTDAVYSAISASVDTANAVSFVSDATKLAVGGFTSSSTAVDVLTTAVNAYGLEISEAAQISDYLVMTQNLGKTTVDELASSVGKVIPLASAYSMEMDNLSTTYAVMTANGIATAEATTYIKGMLSELGNTGSEVAKILQEETGSSFATLMSQGKSLGDVLEIIGDSVDGNTTAFSNLWASQEAGVGALSLYNAGAEKFNSVLLEMQNSAGATESAFNTMADTTSFAKQQMEVAANSTKSAIGDAINPALTELYKKTTAILTGVTEVTSAHPGLVKGIIAVTAGVGTLTVSVVALTNATKLQAAAQAALSAIKMVDPIYLATAAVSALAVAIGTGLVLSMKEAEDSYYSLTEESKRNYDQLQETTAEYEKAVATYGETSSEALSLKYQVEDLTQAYETNKQTVAEYHETFMNEIEAIQESSEQRAISIEKTELEAGSIIYLSERLDELTANRFRSIQQENEIISIVDQLNAAIPDLGLAYDEYTHSLNMATSAVEAYAEAAAKQKLQDKYMDSYAEAYNNAYEATNSLTTAKINLQNAENALQTAMSNPAYQTYLSQMEAAEKGQSGLAISTIALRLQYHDEIEAVNDASRSLATCKEEVEAAQEAVDTANTDMETYIGLMDNVSSFSLDAANSTEDLTCITDELMTVIDDTANSVASLRSAYDEAYTEALETVTGQYNLWDEVDTKVTETTDSLNKSMNQQIEYWNNYNKNLDNLNNRDIDGLNEMLNSINDGSEEAAASLAAMAGASDSELKTMVSNYNKLKESQEKAASSMAETATDFDTKMEEIKTTMTEGVKALDLSVTAEAAATSTMEAYINKISSSKSEAVKAASALATSVANALNVTASIKTVLSVTSQVTDTVSTVTDGSHALGLDYVPYDGYISELHKGEAVLTSSEAETWRSSESTSEIADAKVVSRNETSFDSNKSITLNIVGSGSVAVPNGAISRSEIENIVREQMEPTLVDILVQEIFEESDGVYEF